MDYHSSMMPSNYACSSNYVDTGMAYAQQTAIVLYNPAMMYGYGNPMLYGMYAYPGAFGGVPNGVPNTSGNPFAQPDPQAEKFPSNKLVDDPLNELTDMLFATR